MDDKAFELLKRVDAAFEDGSGPYTGGRRNEALWYIGDEGFDLRMAVMRAVEAEKQRRALVAVQVSHPKRLVAVPVWGREAR